MTIHFSGQNTSSLSYRRHQICEEIYEVAERANDLGLGKGGEEKVIGVYGAGFSVRSLAGISHAGG